MLDKTIAHSQLKAFNKCICGLFSAESVTLNDCLQLSYLPSKRNYMLLLYPREILVLDLEVNQTVGVIAIERTGVPFLQVIIPLTVKHTLDKSLKFHFLLSLTRKNSK